MVGPVVTSQWPCCTVSFHKAPTQGGLPGESPASSAALEPRWGVTLTRSSSSWAKRGVPMTQGEVWRTPDSGRQPPAPRIGYQCTGFPCRKVRHRKQTTGKFPASHFCNPHRKGKVRKKKKKNQHWDAPASSGKLCQTAGSPLCSNTPGDFRDAMETSVYRQWIPGTLTEVSWFLFSRVSSLLIIQISACISKLPQVTTS